MRLSVFIFLFYSLFSLFSFFFYISFFFNSLFSPFSFVEDLFFNHLSTQPKYAMIPVCKIMIVYASFQENANC